MATNHPHRKSLRETLSAFWNWFDGPSVILALTASVSFLLCFYVPETIVRLTATDKQASGWVVLPLIGLFFLAVIVPFLLSLYAILKCMNAEVSRRKRLARVIVSYLANIIAFTGLYYCSALVGDRMDATEKYYYYRQWDVENKINKYRYHISERPPMRSQRAFSGIHDRLFSGVDWQLDGSVRFWTEVPLLFMVERAKSDFDQVIVFIPESRARVLLDCMHFSIVTSATVGYGDISPSTWYTKLTADFQIVQSVVLVVLVLGMLFSGWWEPKPEVVIATGRNVDKQ